MTENVQALKTLHDHAVQQRDAARQRAHAAEQAANAAVAQADQLLTYRSEYEARYRERFSRGGEIQIVMHYQAFMGRLTLAIDSQLRTRDQLEEQRQRVFEQLKQHEVRAASIAKLIERRLLADRQAGDRREQKAVDEQASRLAWTQAQAHNAI